MELRGALIEGFEYDLWANLRWVEPSLNSGQDGVLEHILAAQEVWLARCQGTAFVEGSGHLGERAKRCAAGWIDYLSSADVSSVIVYTTLSAPERTYESAVHEIARHVVTHGAYHRGQMRGVCELQGVEFPETDLVRFLRERGAVSS